MAGMQLRHDVLDAQLVDRDRENIGRCDVLMLELRDGAPPRVAAILVGGSARDARIGRWMLWLAKLLRALVRVDRGGVTRIPFAAMRSLGETLELDVDRRELESERLERWLAAHVVCRIPGSQGGRK